MRASQSSGLASIHFTLELLGAAGMFPVHLRRAVPGFIGYHLQHVSKRKDIALAPEGACDARTLYLVLRKGLDVPD